MSQSTQAFVAPVHGGLAEPVNRVQPRERVLFPAWRKLPAIEVSETDRTTLYRIADGTLSPLTGPMGKADYQNVLDRGAIERSGKRWAWTIPIVLPVTAAEAAACAVGKKVGLHFGGEVFGELVVQSVFDWDKDEFVTKVYGTERQDHPGARLWTTDPRTKCVGGEILLAPVGVAASSSTAWVRPSTSVSSSSSSPPPASGR
jgi:sulfate adenylyltransferase